MEYPKSLQRLLDRFGDKEVYGCSTSGMLGERINFDQYYVSICHEFELAEKQPREVVRFCELEEFSPEVYYEKVGAILEACQDEAYPCRSCSMCYRTQFKFRPINFVTINTSEYCNNSCVYCETHFGAEGSGYDPLPYFKAFHELGLFEADCLFDWGGGEPTLNPHYEAAVKYLSAHGYTQRFNTNAVEFSDSTFEALKAGKGFLRVSPDSGTRECYLQVKGADYHDRVWANIQKYASTGGRIDIKYNVFNLNSNSEDLYGFLDCCTQAGGKHANINIFIDAEARAYQAKQNAGPFYFRKKEFDFAHLLEAEARRRGFNVVISGFAFAARANYKNGVLSLPDIYYDNINHDIISNNIYVRAFASAELMFDKLRKENDLPVYIFGAGITGRLVLRALKLGGIEASFIDNYREFWGTTVDGAPVLPAPEVLKSKPDAHIILAGIQWREKLKEINDAHYENDGRYYYTYNNCYKEYIAEHE